MPKPVAERSLWVAWGKFIMGNLEHWTIRWLYCNSELVLAQEEVELVQVESSRKWRSEGMEVNLKVHKLRDHNHKASVEGLAKFLHQILEDRKNYIRTIENRTRVTRQRSKVLAKELHQIVKWKNSTQNCCAIEKPSPQCLHQDSGLENHLKDEGTSSNHGSSTHNTRSWGSCHVREILAHWIYN